MSTLIVQRSIRKHKSIMLSFVFLSALGAYLWKSMLVIPTKVRCLLENSMSNSARDQLKKYITAQRNQSIKPKEFIKNLKDNFLWINEIALLIQPGLLSITISTHEPFLILNNRTVLTKEGKALAKDDFNYKTVASLPAVTVEDAELNNPHTLTKVALFMEQLPHEIINFYTIHWQNSHAIYFTDKINKNFVLIASADRPLSPKKLYNCLRIKKTLNMQLIKKTNEQWTADTRFADHIIVTKRGNTYGSYVS